MAALSKVFWKASLSRRLKRKDCILQGLLLAVTSLWAHKVGPRGQIYSARWKLMLIPDQAKDLVKNCLQGGGSITGSLSPFQPVDLHSGS